MSKFRRPELEKDNPTAPQIYVGPRRRLAMSRAASLYQEVEGVSMTDALLGLSRAAKEFMKRVPDSVTHRRERSALRKALVEAERLLKSVQAL
jgi:hypothetical protein